MRRTAPWLLAAASFACLGSLACCAGCAAGLQGDTYYGNGYAFRIGALPESWRRVDISHAALAFRDEGEDASVVVNARCGVDGEDVPLSALTQHLFIRFTDREIVDQKVVPFDRREAMRTVITAKLDGVPMKFDVWVMKKDGCVYDLGFMAPPARFDRGAEGFERFVASFATVSPRAN
jgi:hypothetical protein